MRIFLILIVQKMLDFVPTSAEKAFEDTLAFYKKAFVDFPEERDEVLTELFIQKILFPFT